MTPARSARPQLQLLTTADVAALLGVPLSRLTYLLHVVRPERRYKSFELNRKNGPPRVIRAPIKPLKTVQAALAAALSPYYRPPHTVHGYVNGRSIRTNARIHQRQRWVLRVDLEEFFPSINFGRVRGLFLAAPFAFPPPVATLLAQVCCHDNQLPQGAPTSPLISNLICRSLDRQLFHLSNAARCYYTRYCDDLVFSTGRHSFPSALAVVDPQTNAIRVGQELRDPIEKNGFRVNDAKTRLRKRTQRQIVTGLVTNVFVNVPRDYVRSVRMLLHIWHRYGEADAMARLGRFQPKNRPPFQPVPHLALVARGKVQYVGSVKGWGSSVYLGLASRLSTRDSSFRPTQTSPGPVPIEILAEGRTDYEHIRAAIRRLQNAGEYQDLDLQFSANPSDKGGDEELVRHCQALCRIKPHQPVVCIFDRDNAKIIPQVTASDMPFKAWGNDVFSLAIPYPAHRSPNGPLCVEMLYDDELLRQRDSQGRRLYLKSEFREDSGQHSGGERVHCTNPQRGALIRDDDVFDMETGAKVSLSKAAFANAIVNAQPPYANPSVDGFRPLFEVLRRIVEYLRTGR